ENPGRAAPGRQRPARLLPRGARRRPDRSHREGLTFRLRSQGKNVSLSPQGEGRVRGVPVKSCSTDRPSPRPSSCPGRGSKLSGTHAEGRVHVGGAQALAGSATGKIDRVPDHAGEDAVAWLEHGRERLPSVGGRIVDLDLAEQTRDLATKHVEALTDDTRCDARATGRQRGPR